MRAIVKRIFDGHIEALVRGAGRNEVVMYPDDAHYVRPGSRIDVERRPDGYLHFVRVVAT